MIPAILWKEWRDQRTIAVTILTFGALALGLTPLIATATSGQNVLEGGGARELMALAVAYLAGSVCGSMLLADDKEIGTIEFLDSLPCTRRSLWLGKATFGLALTLSMCALIAAMAFAFKCMDSRMSAGSYAVLVFMAGMHGFAWGMFGGAVARSTLGAVFQGAVGSCVIGIAVAIPFAVIQGPMRFGRGFSLSLYLYYAAWMLAGLVLSALVFTSIDRKRLSLGSFNASSSYAGISKPRRTWRPRLASLIWLSARQSLWVALGAWAAGLMFGAALIPPDTIPLLIWPPATLVLGVLAGVTTLSEEQTKGVARFWAEHRLPLGRMWLTKVAFHFLLAVVAALLMSVPLFAVSPASPFRTKLLQQFDMGLRSNLGMFLWFGLVYGFVMGHLSGMLFRKTIVAGLFAVLSSVILAGFLVPSLIGGGMNRWQMWLPALLLLLTARALLYPWATDRIAYRGPILRACAGVALALGSLLLGILYRIHEIPDAPDRLAESEYVEDLPGFDPSDTGRLTRAIASQYRKAAEEAQPLFPPRQAGASSTPLPSMDHSLLERAATTGWTPQYQMLKPWLDRIFAEDWPSRLIELDQKPQGFFEDPREINHFSPLDDIRNLREMMLAVRIRGLQLQAEGDPEAYARLLRGGLAAVRNARFRGSWRTPDAAIECEEVLLGGLFVWLGDLDGRADLLRGVLASLVRHEREMQTNSDDFFWAERVVLANTLQQVGTWLPTHLDGRPPGSSGAKPPSEFEAELVAVAWNIPWERVRRERLLRLSTDTNRKIDFTFTWLSGLHLKKNWKSERLGRLKESDRRGLTVRRFACIRLALHLFELERGRPAEDLNELVPEFLPSVPRDPLSAGFFGYRLSQGELIEFEFRPSVGSLSRPDLLFSELGPATVYVEHFATVLPQFVSAMPSPRQALAKSGVVEPVLPVVFSSNPPKQIVPRGVGILWSSGPDGVDHGAKRNGPSGQGDDWIVLVPPARKLSPTP
ncbi:MAG: hypothetical protein EXS09_00935 [Gemmataceae bacterium]|nr:hypothetical protein [Gemmataceae bacterium]